MQPPAISQLSGNMVLQKPEPHRMMSQNIVLWRSLGMGAEVSDFNWLKKNLGSNCLIAFQSVSERLPKPALKAMKAEPGRQYCKLTSDGS